jgi:hypothetical protein
MRDSRLSKIAKRLRRRTTFWGRYGSSLPRRHSSVDDFEQLRAFCLFVGYPRSGSTLLASMLNAHPAVLLGHELDVLGFVRLHASKAQIFHAIRESADAFSQSGLRWEGYDYRIGPPTADGDRELHVIGDKEAAMAAVHLGRGDSLLERLQDTVGLPVKVVHIVRDPFDNIATMYLRGRYPILHLPLARCIGDFAAMTRTIEGLKRRLDPEALLEVRHEDVVEHPLETLAGVCTFLGIEPTPEYLLTATSIVRGPATSSRNRLVWRLPDVQRVEEIIASSSAHSSYAGSRPSRVETSANRAAWCRRHRPDFLVIGAQRCGTTLMHRLLEEHPEVYVPKHRKEVHFFDEHYERGERWYREFFPFDREGFAAIGEVSPAYLADPKVPERIHEFDPHMRLVVMLRHPVERLWSAYHHLHRINGFTRSFEDFIREDLDAVERGKYAEQLSRYVARFPREQILVVVLEDLILDPDAELGRIQQFLELREPWKVDRAALIRVNENFVVRYPTLYRSARRTGQLLTDRLDQGRIASKVKRSRAMSLFKSGESFEALTPELRATLHAYYAPDMLRLREEFGVETATWGVQAPTSESEPVEPLVPTPSASEELIAGS